MNFHSRSPCFQNRPPWPHSSVHTFRQKDHENDAELTRQIHPQSSANCCCRRIVPSHRAQGQELNPQAAAFENIWMVFQALLGDVQLGATARGALALRPDFSDYPIIARYKESIVFIFKLILKKLPEVAAVSCRMPPPANRLPDAPHTSCYIML